MDLRGVLRRDDGVIAREEALRHLTSSAVGRKLARGEWTIEWPGVYHDAARPRDARSRIRALLLWLGPEAVLSGLAAAAWWRLYDGPVPVIEACVPRRCTRGSPPGARLVRRDVGLADRCVVDGIAVTAKAVTVLDVAVALGGTAGRALLDRAIQERVSLETLERAHARRPRRRGAPAAARLLREAADRTASEPERRTVALLAAAGLVAAVNHEVRCRGHRYVLDLAFVEQKVAVEVHGWAFHRGRDRFVADPRRKNLLTLDGWLVLEVTWDDLRDHPETVVAQVLEAVASRTAA